MIVVLTTGNHQKVFLMHLRYLLIAFVSFGAAVAEAHPGGLNSSGCHKETATGSYHCHNTLQGSQGSIDGYMQIQAAPSRPRPSSRPAVLYSGQVAVISVGDGDTIRVKDSAAKLVTIRLACIDAPETAQGATGQEATAALRSMVGGPGGVVSLMPQQTDRYGRTVAEVFAGGHNVNLEMVRQGQAYAYREYLAGCNASAYLQAEMEARTSQLGVWRFVQEYPWEFRKSRRK